MKRVRPRAGARTRVTLRTRLTLAYGALLAVVAGTLIALLYAFMTYVPVYSERLSVDGGGPNVERIGLGEGASGWAPPMQGSTFSADCADPSLSEVVRTLRGKLIARDEGSAHISLCGVTPTGEIGPDGWAVTYEISTKDDFLRSLLLFSAAALAVLLVVALLVGWFVAGRMLAPLQKVTATARGIAGSTLHERIDIGGPKDEIRQLAETFNDMLRRLDRSFEAQRRFASNASHELKTPLTGMRTILQVALAAPQEYRLQEIGPKLLTLTSRSADILNALLTLARADQGGVDKEKVELGAVARESVTEAGSQADELGVTVSVDCGRAEIMGDRVLLRQLTGNLVQNAVRHNHRGGSAEVRVEESPDRRVARFVVRNTGRRFSREEADQMREPFHRLDTRQSTRTGRPAGHGLGLAVAESITRAHSGTLDITPLPDGGLETVVVLPLTTGGSPHGAAPAGLRRAATSEAPPRPGRNRGR
ncbi:sensor histidine kinase [Streptomyces cadmiisoli]|uniref:sensor histidine kinase n=1 Tax=Streptomyces cadmiisoli TaxID=2184053 RepID=UPI003654F6EC